MLKSADIEKRPSCEALCRTQFLNQTVLTEERLGADADVEERPSSQALCRTRFCGSEQAQLWICHGSKSSADLM